MRNYGKSNGFGGIVKGKYFTRERKGRESYESYKICHYRKYILKAFSECFIQTDLFNVVHFQQVFQSVGQYKGTKKGLHSHHIQSPNSDPL